MEKTVKNIQPRGLRKPAIIAAVLLVIALLALGILPRLSRQQKLVAAAEPAGSGPVAVRTIKPQVKDSLPLELPGSLLPYREARIFARSSGFIKKRYVDIGATVKAGQLLAQVESPELDQQIAQQQANVSLAKTTLTRYTSVTIPGAVAQQQLDQAQANYQAQAAQLAQLQALKRFQQITAPFDGVITVRNIEEGDLITAGSTTGNQELFRIAQTHRLRMAVFVPQSYAMLVANNMSVHIRVPEIQDQDITGTVVRTSQSLVNEARNLRAEIEIPNPGNRLLAGAFAYAGFDLSTGGHKVITIPVSALVINAKGSQVAVVNAQRKISWVPVKVARDMGARIEIASGLTGDEQLVNNPPDYLKEGDEVAIAQ